MTEFLDFSKFPPTRSLLERNAEQLAELDDGWGTLGSSRQINYHFRLANRGRAQEFAAKVKAAGFHVDVGPDGQWDCEVTASIDVEPTAEKITALQQELESFLEWHGPEEQSHADGWSCPDKRVISFSDSASNTEATEARASVLFGSGLVSDPLQKPRCPLNPSPPGARPTFEIMPSEFLRKAQTMRPDDPQPTASAFSQWVYSLYGHANGSEEDIAGGKEAEEDIWRRRRTATSCIDNSFLRSAGRKWSLIHNGLHLRDRDKPAHFEIPQLCVKGEALRASPDLVFVSDDRSEAIIVEVKFSRQLIPRNLWPNVWAQLWCYSKLHEVAGTEKVTAVGEVWGETYSTGYGGRVPGEKLICLRALVRRNPRARAYDQFFRRLFEIYSGQG